MTTTASAPALSVERLSKSFNGRTVLTRLELEIAPGEIHALVGENGSGKSTLIKVLAGYHEPDDGATISIAGAPLSFGSPKSSYALGCRFVHQDLGLIQDMSILDNMLLNTGFPTRAGSIRTREARRTVTEDLRRVGLDISPDVWIKDLSAATRTGVAVARALRADPSSTARFIVLDEPTATLPDNEVHQLLAIVRAVAARGIGVLYVTHRLNEIFEIGNNVTVLRNGHKVATEPVSSITRAELVNQLVGREFAEISDAAAALPPTSGREVLVVQNLSAGPIKDVSFTVRAGEVTGFAGITGSGAESVLSAVFGGISRDSGSVTVLGRPLVSGRPDRSVAAGVGYMPPDRKVLGGMLEQSARENITIGSLRGFASTFRIRRGSERAEARRWFADLAVSPADGIENDLGTFSGGNQQKILFAKWLRLKPAVFMLDEPTQGVDIGAKALLHHQLIDAAAEGMAVVVSSTDVDELAVLCQRILVIRDGEIVAELRGDDVNVSKISAIALGTTHENAA